MHSLTYLFNKCLNANYKDNDIDTSYAFVEEGDTLYIYFEGSVTKLDWFHNFMFKKKPYKDMKNPYKMHRGFLKCWKSIEDIIIAKITEKLDDQFKWKSIRVVGYSHGAALAMLCHECCWYHRNDIAEDLKTIGFEGPRVYGSYKVKDSLKERWKNFRLIRNHTDIVTHVPPFIFGYTHVEEIIKIKRQSFYCFVKAHMWQNVMESLNACDFNEDWEIKLYS